MSQGKFEKKSVAQRHAGQEPETTPVQQPRKPKHRHTGKKIAVVLLSILLVILLCIAVAADYVLGRLGRFEDPSDDETPVVEEFDVDSTIEGQETIETQDASDVTFESVEELISEDVVNIMLIGQDARPGEGRSRSDTMLLITMNPPKNAIQMTSFMRDTDVQIPGYRDNRLNVAYRFGGTELMNETFKKNFGIEIDGNVMVNFEEFAGIIDLLGGVDMELSAEEVGYMNRSGCSTREGLNHLNGEDALTYVRMRKVSGGDYGRTERQRKVIGALIESFRSATLPEILNLVDELLPKVVTSVSGTDILRYATTGASLLANGAEIQTMRIPADDAHHGAMIDGMSVLVPNLGMCREDLDEFIYQAAADATEP